MAEELAQEIFIRVYKAAPNYTPDAKFSTWLYRIATNVCLNELRKKRYTHETASIDGPVPIETGNSLNAFNTEKIKNPAEDFEKKEREKIIRDSIAGLPEKQRAALLLKIDHDFSYEEIGKELNTSEKSVKSLIHRGRQNLKQALSAYLGGNK